MSTLKTAVNILKKTPRGKLSITKLHKELARQGALGFGVDAEDVVITLIEQGLVTYDNESEVVSLKTT